jgi:hypothetical protein
LLQTTAQTIHITPLHRLVPRELPTLLLDTSIGDLNGNSLKQVVQVQFTTTGPNWQKPQLARNGGMLLILMARK